MYYYLVRNYGKRKLFYLIVKSEIRYKNLDIIKVGAEQYIVIKFSQYKKKLERFLHNNIYNA